jgi:multidrug efflux pump subunit AcrA (membrane-fusion protein)
MKKFIPILCIGLIGGMLAGCGNKEEAEKSPPKKATIVDLIAFGSWEEDSIQMAPGKVVSSQDVTITAKLSGTIKNVYVSLGDSVKKGQVLAEFDRSLDPVQVQYENALRNFNVQKTVAQNSVKSAENALANAQKNYEKITAQESQSGQNTLDSLQTQYLLTQTHFRNVLDFMDQYTGASGKFLVENYPSQHFIGAKNKALRTAIQDKIRIAQKDILALPQAVSPPRRASGFEPYSKTVRDNAEIVLRFGERLQYLLADFETLLNATIFTSSYTEAQFAPISVQSQNFNSQLQSQILTLTGTVQQNNLQGPRSSTALQQAKNQVAQAEQSLALAKSNASAQVQSAQNQIYQARSSQKEFRILAPFEAEISDKMIEANMSVGLGQSLFQLTNPDEGKKVTATVPSKWQQTLWQILPPSSETEETAKKSEEEDVNEEEEKNLEIVSPTLALQFSDGQKSFCHAPKITGVREARTQKVSLECDLENSEAEIGDRVTLVLSRPTQGSNLLPLSAFAFEPEGTEVLVGKISGENYILERRNVEVGALEGNAIPVISGLELGEYVAPFYYQVLPGEIVEDL